MDIQAVARKLEPLMAKEVGQWLKTRELGDPEIKDLIEKQIISVAYKKLGDFHKKVLLSLPPEEKAKGPLHLGTVVYEKEKWPFGIFQRELTQHLAIFGRSGAGKTNVALHLLEELVEKRIPFLFLDWKRTARHFLPQLPKRARVYTPGRRLSPFPFNPFAVPPGLEPEVYLQKVVDVMGTAYTLGAGARSLIQRALGELYRREDRGPTVPALQEAVEKLETRERASGWKISALRALQALSAASLAPSDRVRQEDLVHTVLEGSTIIELDALADDSKKFLIPLLCLWIFHAKLAEEGREKLSLVVFLEEAHHVLHRGAQGPTVMEQFLRQCRELGIGVVVVDQHPSLISQTALGNCFATICMNLKDPTDLNKAAALSLVEESEKQYFSLLPVGQGIVKLQDRWRRPFLVQFPLLDIEKGAVTDEALARYLEDSRALSGVKSSPARPIDALGRIRFSDKGLEPEAFVLLQDVLEHSDDGVDARYGRLGFSGDRGNRLKNQLLRQGIVEGQLVRIGTSRKLLLRITDGAREELGIDGRNPGRESLAHEYWKRYYARHFRERGFQVTIEAPRRNGRADVLAVKPAGNGTRASESVAIEIETGKSDVVWNVKQDLLMGWKVMVVATDGEAMRRVERELSRAMLMLTGRVEVVQAGGLAHSVHK